MNKDFRIYVAGHKGLLGSAIVRLLRERGFKNIGYYSENLADYNEARFFYQNYKPNIVFLAAAKVGNIKTNITYPLDFLRENLLIQENILRLSHEFGVDKLLFFSSNCCYPRECLQPMKEEYLMTGPLEPTNEGYAIAKIVGMKLCQSYNTQHGTKFYSLVLASLYGPNDHFGSDRAHVIADMIHKFHQAKEGDVRELTFWGDGLPLREFMFVDDAADAAMFLMDNFNSSLEDNIAGRMFLNAGTGEEISIADLAKIIADVVGYEGKVNWDISKPSGMPHKLLDSSRFYMLGWSPKMSLKEGIRKTYHWYLENKGSN